MRLGDYELENQLGEGGMAKVYKARHVVLETLHAVKVLDKRFRELPDARKRFLDEARIQAKHLDHPNIVKVTNIISTTEAAALVMELVEGSSLDRELPSLKTRLADAKQIMLGVLDGVGHAHGKGIIHRDLKPANVLLAKRDGKLMPKVTDFGIAKVSERAEGGADKKKSTHVDARMGTLVYMSPEQLRRAKDVTPRSDVFSLGVMLYEMSTGLLPFEGDSDYDVMESIVNARYTPASTRNPKVDATLSAVIDRALAGDPAERFASCEDMAAALRGDASALAALAKVPAKAKPAPTKSTTPAPPATTSPAPPAAAAVGSSRLLGFGLLAVALAVGGLAVVLALKKDDVPATTANVARQPPAPAPPVDPLAMPATATRLASGVAYVFLVGPSNGWHPQRGDQVNFGLTPLAADGSRLPRIGASVAFNEAWPVDNGYDAALWDVIPLMTADSTVRVWLPNAADPSHPRVLDLELSSIQSPLPPPPPMPHGQNPAPAAPAPGASPPLPLPRPNIVTGAKDGETFCVSDHKAACSVVQLPKWHFHGYVRHQGACLACWDEESSTCEQIVDRGYDYVGTTSCGCVDCE